MLILVGFMMSYGLWLNAIRTNLSNIALMKALQGPEGSRTGLAADFTSADAETARSAQARGVALLLAKQPELAVAALERAEALEAQATDPVTQLWLGDAYRAAGDLEDAIVAWDRAGGVRTLDRKGDELRLAGQLATATIVFEAIAQHYPTAAAGYAGLGLVALDRQDWPVAEPWFSQALARDPDSPDAHTGLATALIQTGRYDAARAHLERAIALKPEAIAAYLLMGDTFTRQGDYAAARTWYQQAATHFPSSAEPDIRLALAAVTAGQPQDAFAALDAAARKDPGNHQRQIALSRAYRLAGQPQAALAALEQGAALAPNDLWTWIWLGDAYREAARCDEAQAAYARAAELDPGNPQVAAHQAVSCPQKRSAAAALRASVTKAMIPNG